MARSQWQSDQNLTTKQKTAAMMVEARRRGWKDWEIKQRFQEMGMPGSSSSSQYPQFNYNKRGFYELPTAKEEDEKAKRNQLQIAQEADKENRSFSSQGLQAARGNKNLYDMGSGIFGYGDDPGKKEEKSWWSNIGEQLGDKGFLGGVKGWIGLGTDVMDAYTGFQQVGLAREENEMARQNLAFQQNAWGKDYTARRIAYNQNAMDRQFWKNAQTPGGYAAEELVPA